MKTIILNKADIHKGNLILINYQYPYHNNPDLPILKEDNIINKIGLKIPFMIDLSVKLQDYDLISKMTLDMNGMVNKLWK